VLALVSVEKRNINPLRINAYQWLLSPGAWNNPSSPDIAGKLGKAWVNEKLVSP